MAEKNEGDQDPSMEEILQSIRSIIAEDDDASGESQDQEPVAEEETPVVEAAEPKPKTEEKLVESEPQDDSGSDVLELTDMVDDDGAVVNLEESEPEDKRSLEDVLENIDNALSDAVLDETIPATEVPEEIPMPQEEPEEEPKKPTPAIDKDKLVDDSVAAASSAAFKKLSKTVQPDELPPLPSPQFRGGTTVEDLVRESLRPMLKEWLDDNLEELVKRIVEREIRKLTKDD